MLRVTEFTLDGLSGGQSSVIPISSTSAQSAAIGTAGTIDPMNKDNWAVVIPTVDCFFRVGTNPTALSDGTDQFLSAYCKYRIYIPKGYKFAFKTTGQEGFVYLTPNA